MKLLFDQNLSHHLVRQLADIFPGSTHVKDTGLDAEDDRVIWSHARETGYAIISKDGDFQHMSFLYGAPPKIVWLRCGNRSTEDIERLVRANFKGITAFLGDVEGSLLVINERQGNAG